MEKYRVYYVVLAVGMVLCGGFTAPVRAGAPSGTGAEHVSAGMGMGKVGGGWAALNRPANETEARAMKEVLCPCGTCTRLSIGDCDCETAAQLRAKVQGLLVGVDLSNDAAKRRAYDSVLFAFTSEYGEKVLGTPKSNTSWLFPSLAVVGALGLLVFAGRRWVARGTTHSTQRVEITATSTAGSALDEKYADRLDDELDQTD